MKETTEGLVVDRTGALSLIQDLGRGGQAHLGVSPSGAAAPTALRLANRLVGNPEGAAAIECLFGGLQVRSRSLCWVTVTGAPTEVLVNGTGIGSHSSIPLGPGDTLLIQAPPRGVRSYLAVRGGILCHQTLGSRSTDVLSGLGPAPLEPGQQLEVGRATQPLPDTDLAPPNQPRKSLGLLPGPRRDWFTPSAWQRLLTAAWKVSSDSDRVATRLGGPGLERARPEELPSEAIIRGAIQVTSSGLPLIFGPDHPVTGGYPVIAVLTDRDADHAAQLRPGETVHFTQIRG
ncbi:MAG: biotin-dependent carboxyltransferase family protein [Microlunatus sp.]|nr:biotin-dependent carboxyltransferase family protein [Microlunatus sp.]